MRQKLSKFLFFLIIGIFSANFAFAQPVCPVCVVAIGAGLGFSRWLGVDDLITSVWIGAGLLTLTIWTLHWLYKKNWNFRFSGIVAFVFYYVLTFVPLYWVGIVGHPLNTIFGIDKILFGTIVGTIVLAAGLYLNNFLKIKNNGKQFFNYQKVVVPILALILISIIFYFLLWI